MGVARRGNSWIVSMYDKRTKKKRHVATYRTQGEAIEAEAAVLRGLPLPERDPLNGYRVSEPVVYFVVAADLGLVKIGFATDLHERFRGLQTASPVELRIMHVEPGTQALEQAIHRRFRVDRVRGEWFRIAGPLAEYLDAAFDNPRLRLVEEEARDAS